MSKGTLVIEFTTVADLLDQLCAIMKGIVPAPETMPAASGYRYPELERAPVEEAEPAKAEPVEKPDPLPEKKPEPTVEKKAEPTPEKRPEEVKKPEPSADEKKVVLTAETVGTCTWEELLLFCKQNPTVGQDVSKPPTQFLRPMIEHKVKVFLTTK